MSAAEYSRLANSEAEVCETENTHTRVLRNTNICNAHGSNENAENAEPQQSNNTCCGVNNLQVQRGIDHIWAHDFTVSFKVLSMTVFLLTFWSLFHYWSSPWLLLFIIITNWVLHFQSSAFHDTFCDHTIDWFCHRNNITTTFRVRIYEKLSITIFFICVTTALLILPPIWVQWRNAAVIDPVSGSTTFDVNGMLNNIPSLPSRQSPYDMKRRMLEVPEFTFTHTTALQLDRLSVYNYTTGNVSTDAAAFLHTHTHTELEADRPVGNKLMLFLYRLWPFLYLVNRRGAAAAAPIITHGFHKTLTDEDITRQIINDTYSIPTLVWAVCADRPPMGCPCNGAKLSPLRSPYARPENSREKSFQGFSGWQITSKMASYAGIIKAINAVKDEYKLNPSPEEVTVLPTDVLVCLTDPIAKAKQITSDASIGFYFLIPPALLATYMAARMAYFFIVEMHQFETLIIHSQLATQGLT